jgi:hypothetical protein
LEEERRLTILSPRFTSFFIPSALTTGSDNVPKPVPGDEEAEMKRPTKRQYWTMKVKETTAQDHTMRPLHSVHRALLSPATTQTPRLQGSCWPCKDLSLNWSSHLKSLSFCSRLLYLLATHTDAHIVSTLITCTYPHLPLWPHTLSHSTPVGDSSTQIPTASITRYPRSFSATGEDSIDSRNHYSHHHQIIILQTNSV